MSTGAENEVKVQILWINEAAALTGGCERYISDTAVYLREYGITSSLLYNVAGATEPRFTGAFDRGAFPLVDLELQIQEIRPDLIYVHRWEGTELFPALRACGVPAARFFHDHRLFCPREHKYTVLGKRTCTKTVGWNCYTCLGIVNKVSASDGLIRVQLPGALRREQQENIRTYKAFVAGSGYMANHLIAHGFPASTVHSIPLFTAPPEFANVELSPERDLETLLFVGQLVTGKGVDTLLEAVAQTKHHCQLRIIGAGKFERDYRALAERLGIQGRVTFVGKVLGMDLAREYRRCAAVVFPSRTPETFGLVGPEAMSHGTPVIATNVGGMTEWLRDGVNGLAVPPNAPAELARAIDRLLGDASFRKRLSLKARNDYEARFTPERHVKALASLFRQVVSAREVAYAPAFSQEALA